MKNQSYLLPEDLIEKMDKVRALTGCSRSHQLRSILNAFFLDHKEMLAHLQKEYRVKDLNGYDLNEHGISSGPNTLAHLVNDAAD